MPKGLLYPDSGTKDLISALSTVLCKDMNEFLVAIKTHKAIVEQTRNCENFRQRNTSATTSARNTSDVHQERQRAQVSVMQRANNDPG